MAAGKMDGTESTKPRFISRNKEKGLLVVLCAKAEGTKEVCTESSQSSALPL